MLGVGIDYAIQMHSRIEEEVVIDQAEHPIQEAAVNLGPALLVVAFDAIFAFLALRFAKVPMIRDFGLLLAVGIAAICVCSIVLPIAILGIREFRSPTKGRDFSHGTLAKLVVWLGALPSRTGRAAGHRQRGHLRRAASWSRTSSTSRATPRSGSTRTPRSSRTSTPSSETGSSAELGIFIESDDVFSDETVAFVTDFANEAGGAARGAADRLVHADHGVVPAGGAGHHPAAPGHRRGAGLRGGAAGHPGSWSTGQRAQPGVPHRAGSLTSGRCTSTRSATSWSGRDRRRRGRPRGRAGHAVRPGRGGRGPAREHRVEPHPAHLPGHLFVFLFLSVRLRSVVRALLSMVPVLIAVGAASLVAWA